MSDHFASEKDCPCIRTAQAAYIAALTAELLPPLRIAARGAGYALTTHGTMARDIDLVAIAWTASAVDADHLVDRLLGVIAGVTGRALLQEQQGGKRYTAKPHGRRAYFIIHGGHTAEIDLSVMPPALGEEDEA